MPKKKIKKNCTHRCEHMRVTLSTLFCMGGKSSTIWRAPKKETLNNDRDDNFSTRIFEWQRSKWTWQTIFSFENSIESETTELKSQLEIKRWYFHPWDVRLSMDFIPFIQCDVQLTERTHFPCFKRRSMRTLCSVQSECYFEHLSSEHKSIDCSIFEQWK